MTEAELPPFAGDVVLALLASEEGAQVEAEARRKGPYVPVARLWSGVTVEVEALESVPGSQPPLSVRFTLGRAWQEYSVRRQLDGTISSVYATGLHDAALEDGSFSKADQSELGKWFVVMSGQVNGVVPPLLPVR